MTKLAVSILVRHLGQALADAARAAEFGAELVEYRIDQVGEDADLVVALVEGSPLPCILTCRPVWEGGFYEGDEAQRFELLGHAFKGVRAPAYLDLELAAYQRHPDVLERIGIAGQMGQAAGTGLILSSHDFHRRPTDLYQKVEAMVDAPDCRVIKVAWQARSLRDNLEAFELLLQQYKPTIALCMGEFGLASRVLAKKFGALLTFASLDEASATAPGQPTLEQLKRLYRWDRIGRHTSVYGVIGWPVGHSLSPRLHNAGFDAAGYDGVYLPLPIPEAYEHFKATVGSWLAFEPLEFRGASVTIPHKEHLLRFVRESGGEIEPLAQAIGAANTLVKRDDGTLYACNTDYAAALDAICEGLDIGRDQLAGRQAAVIGAGGAARAIVAGLAHSGASVTIYNRTPQRAMALVRQFRDAPGRVEAASLEELSESAAEVYVNCTPVGMHPNVDASPIPADRPMKGWGPGVVVFDTIYNPTQTLLLKQAQAAGCRTIPGMEMFVRQGAAQFELWTGQPAPLEAFRAALRGE